jgi:threonine/homoserine/homoserine lactone efflux protein
VAEFLAFFVVAMVVIVTPGPDTALTTRNALLGGRRSALFTALGVSAGQATWTLATAAGVAALLRASEPAFVALKFAGAAYLVFLGAQSLRAALLGRQRKQGFRSSAALLPHAAFRQGLVSNLANPKMPVFFLSLLPQFAPATFFALIPLGLAFCAMTLAWLAVVGTAVARAGDFLRRSWVKRLLDAVTGAILVALGLRLATERR